MTSRVLFFSCEPGGAEVLIPVVRLLQERNFDVEVAAYGHGYDRFCAKGVMCREVEPVGAGDTHLLASTNPDLLITSAASLPDRDQSERRLWLGARQHSIPSLAFLDQWQNYSARFSGVSPDSRLAYLPDFISCIDEVGRREMIAEGFPQERLKAFGQPYLSSLKDQVTKASNVDARRRLGLSADEPILLFASEAIQQHFGRTRGYDQHDALELFFSLLATGIWSGRPVVKLHPKESPEQYAGLLEQHAAFRPLLVTSELSPAECLAMAMHVFGMTSIMLIEAYVLGLPVISLQPGLVGEDPLVLSRLGIIPIARSQHITPPSGIEGFSWDFPADAFLAFLDDILRLRAARKPVFPGAQGVRIG